MAGQLDRYPLCSLMTFLCNCRSGGLAFARPNGFEAGFKLLGLLGELFCVGFLQLCQITKLPADAWHLFKVRYVENGQSGLPATSERRNSRSLPSSPC